MIVLNQNNLEFSNMKLKWTRMDYYMNKLMKYIIVCYGIFWHSFSNLLFVFYEKNGIKLSILNIKYK